MHGRADVPNARFGIQRCLCGRQERTRRIFDAPGRDNGRTHLRDARLLHGGDASDPHRVRRAEFRRPRDDEAGEALDEGTPRSVHRPPCRACHRGSDGVRDALLAAEAERSGICLTLTGKTLEEDIEQYRSQRYFSDMVELRVDLLKKGERAKAAAFPKMLAKSSPWKVPIVLTFRKACDGGAFKGKEAERVRFFERVLTQRRVTAPCGWPQPVGTRPSRAKRVPRGAECAEFFMAACGRGQGGGGGAKVRASGYGVFAEVPRGEAFGHRRRL